MPCLFYDKNNPTATNLYKEENGTSFASPMVAGVAGLMLSVNPCLKPHEIESILKSTASNIYSIPENVQYAGQLGAGRVDAFEAVKRLIKKRLYFLRIKH
ncbi:MAG: S8 family serine peptidase [Bacteroidetes bacterium]|nr:S8 family serine peptidase [Bacteroidota bacterium]